VLLGDIADVWAVPWLDDIIVVGRTEAETAKNRDYVLSRIQYAGVELNAEKTMLSPGQQIEFAGVEWQLAAARYRLPQAWCLRAKVVAADVVSRKRITLREAWKCVGQLVWAARVCEVPLCGFAHVLDWASERGREVHADYIGWDSLVRVSAGMLRDIEAYVAGLLTATEWRAPRRGQAAQSSHVVSDAHVTGWGFIVDGVGQEWGAWRARMGELTSGDMFLLELAAAEKALAAAADTGARDVVIHVDNLALKFCLNKGHTALRVGNEILRRIFDTADRAGMVFCARWIHTDENPADELSRRVLRGQSPGREWFRNT
jgi:ribonuclease HI